MTIAPPAETAELAVVDAAPAPPPRRPPFNAERIRPAVVRGLFVALVLIGVVVFFQSIVASTWFHARQRQLLTEFQAPQAHLHTGHAAALLEIPSLKMALVVVEGDATGQLRSGPGHRPRSPLPGKRGNSILLGHRNGWGSPFADLTKIRKGDYIVTKTRSASNKVVVYKVTAIRHVAATDTHLFIPTKDFRLTLVTSDGGLLSDRRLVIQAVSGDTLKPTRRTGPEVTVPHGSVFLNWAVAVSLAAFAAAAVAGRYLRRHYGLGALLAVLIPLILAGLFAALIDLDRLLPPLR